MANTELIDVAHENAQVREALRRDATFRAAQYCGAKSTAAFLMAVEAWQHEITEIERKGKCLACGWALDANGVCVDCGRDNS